jgi:hypothetical protein
MCNSGLVDKFLFAYKNVLDVPLKFYVVSTAVMCQSVCSIFYVVKDLFRTDNYLQLVSVCILTFFYNEMLLNICFTHPLPGVDTWLRSAINSSVVDVLVKPETVNKVKEFLDSSGLAFDIIIDNLQAAIDTENPTITPEEMEELEGRKGEEFEFCVYQFVVLLY